MQITTKQAAKILEVSVARMLTMIYDGRFGEVQKFGNCYSLDAEIVQRVKTEMQEDSRSNVSKTKASRVSQPRVKVVKKRK